MNRSRLVLVFVFAAAAAIFAVLDLAAGRGLSALGFGVLAVALLALGASQVVRARTVARAPVIVWTLPLRDEVLDAAGIAGPDRAGVAAIRALRRADPRLDLAQAVALARGDVPHP